MTHTQPPYLEQKKEKSFFRRNGSYLALLLGMTLVGFLAQFQWIGYIVVVAYAVVALLRRMPARTTYILALATLGVVPVAVLLSNVLVARNFASYSLALFVLGVVVTVIELQRESRTK